MAQLPHDARIELALSDLAGQEPPDFMRTAKKYDVNCMTLTQQFHSLQISRAQDTAEVLQNLNPDEEQTVIDFINQHTERSLSLTAQLVKNIVEEVCMLRP